MSFQLGGNTENPPHRLRRNPPLTFQGLVPVKIFFRLNFVSICLAVLHGITDQQLTTTSANPSLNCLMKKRRNFISSYRHLAHQIFLQVVATDKAKQRLRTFLRSGFPQNRALGHKGAKKKKQRCLDKLNPRCCPDPSESSKKPLPFGWATMPSHGDLPREEILASCHEQPILLAVAGWKNNQRRNW